MTLAVAVLFALILIVLAIPQLVALWRGRPSEDWVEVMSVLVGAGIARGMVRALPMLYLVVVGSTLFVVLRPVVEASLPGMERSVTGVFTLAYVVVWLLALAVIAINRPRIVVPPHLRSQPGVLREWFRDSHDREGS